MSKLVRFPSKQYINTQRYQVAASGGSGGSNNGVDRIIFSITSFRRAELVGLLCRWCPFMAVPTIGTTAITYAYNGNNFYDGDEISSMDLLFNGVQIWRNNACSDPLWDVLSGEKPSYMGFKRQYLQISGGTATTTNGFVNSGVQYYVNQNNASANKDYIIINTNNQTNTNATSLNTQSTYYEFYGRSSALDGITVNNPISTDGTSALGLVANRAKEARYYNINLSEIRANMMNNNEYALGYDLSKQTLNLAVTLPLAYNSAATPSANGGYFYITYIYNSVYQLEENQSSILAF